MKWSIVKVYYADGEDLMYRVVGINDEGIICKERIFNTELSAERYLLEQKTRESLGI
jgi:hypothetical protein